MYEKINYKLVGLFVVLFSALAIYTAFWLAKSGLNNKNYNMYISYFSESVDGLNKDSDVKLNGVDVGRVIKISISNRYPSKVRVDMAISKKVKITKDMYAVLKNQGVTGLRYINIEGGKSKELIKPNSQDSIIKTKISMLANVSNTLPQTLDKLLLFSNKLDKLLSKDNLSNFSKILENGTKVTYKAVEIEDKINNILKDMNNSGANSLKQFVTLAKDINKSIATTLTVYKKLGERGNITLKNINKKLPKLLADLDITLKNVSKTSKTIDKTVKRGDYNFKRILRPTIVDLKELSVEYKDLANELKALAQNPAGTIFNGKSRPKGPGE